MRTDCTRDNRKVRLPNASTTGYNLWNAKRGNWVEVGEGYGLHFGRVLSRVTCQGVVYVEVLGFIGASATLAVRWLAPGDILACRAEPPRERFAVLFGDWTDGDRLRRIGEGLA